MASFVFPGHGLLQSRRTARCAQKRKPTLSSISPSPGIKKIAEVLQKDLPRQYSHPLEMDWGIYDQSVTFDDPATKLSGKLMYKGMIYTIAFITATLFTSTEFVLEECVVESEEKVRTRFWTSGETRWGSKLVISGVDWFWCKDGKIVRHQSTWDQTGKELKENFLGKKRVAP